MITDLPTAEELERLRTPHPDQLDLEADSYAHLIDLDHMQEPSQ